MKGRIYDPTLGRFLQADPHIQAPKNSQNYNRYSYVLNNPMSYTDPSGFFFKKLLGGLFGTKVLGALAKVPLLNAAVQIGVGIGCGAAAAACLAAYNGLQTYAVTGSLGASLRSAAISYATAYAFSEIGSHFDGLKKTGSINFGGNMLTGGQVAKQISAHALVGGITAELQGGKFGHGFFSAGVTKGLGGAFLPGGDKLSTGEIVKGTVVSAIIGGTASKISGGKFANGAQTGAFQYMFNQAAPKIIDSTKEALDHYLNGNGQDVQLGPTTQDAVKNSTDQQNRLTRIKQGLTTSNTGNYGVDVTSETFHVGDTPLHYNTVCNNTTCTTSFESRGDGFWDPVYSADGIGPKGEFFGGTPFRYLPFQWQESYPKP
jgi:hypothetical protein